MKFSIDIADDLGTGCHRAKKASSKSWARITESYIVIRFIPVPWVLAFIPQMPSVENAIVIEYNVK